LLTAALLVNIIVPMNVFLALPGADKVILSCAVVFVPVFFAGHYLRHDVSRQPEPEH
jgi:hypothetical protein